MTDQRHIPRHHKVVLADVTLHYLDAGNPGGGESVVLLHGWPQSAFAWRHVQPGLANGCRVIAPDLRGLRRFLEADDRL